MKRRTFAAGLALGTFLTPAALRANPRAALQETPSLAEQVKSGTLPPVAQRVPEQPSIVSRFAGSDGPGRSGGEINMLVASARDTRLMTIFSNGMGA